MTSLCIPTHHRSTLSRSTQQQGYGGTGGASGGTCSSPAFQFIGGARTVGEQVVPHAEAGGIVAGIVLSDGFRRVGDRRG